MPTTGRRTNSLPLSYLLAAAVVADAFYRPTSQEREIETLFVVVRRSTMAMGRLERTVGSVRSLPTHRLLLKQPPCSGPLQPHPSPSYTALVATCWVWRVGAGGGRGRAVTCVHVTGPKSQHLTKISLYEYIVCCYSSIILVVSNHLVLVLQHHIASLCTPK